MKRDLNEGVVIKMVSDVRGRRWVWVGVGGNARYFTLDEFVVLYLSRSDKIKSELPVDRLPFCFSHLTVAH